ncbi:hypothetical protein [Micromonospora sp. NPDC049679]|uniref:hypothetical protein n=1 Tax=Micromonospora sp. NPDC049679 TaxID=3155920 RepID=UPI0034012BB0
MGITIGTIAGLFVGFLVGLLTFKQKQQWCHVCGATLRCPACAAASTQANTARNRGPAQRPVTGEQGKASRAGRWWR